ncbi:hypothetical protein [Acetobacter vaccinii]|uniref:Uncharacterized protein n=1 Tax=Acetobacter vaccinii TaxID=2592655 RepID=A0A5C1YLF5_9PROT|nr:hypothetical protein [Acetobacter vaccinii]QEO17106.1 hypothetical protein FLP30_04595 [Acetobacter vaccinii]
MSGPGVTPWPACRLWGGGVPQSGPCHMQELGGVVRLVWGATPPPGPPGAVQGRLSCAVALLVQATTRVAQSMKG